jgi:hypothetical protein
MLEIKKSLFLLIALLSVFLLLGCNPKEPQHNQIRVELVVDNTRSVYTFDRPISVQQLLDSLGIDRSPLDNVVPPTYTQITDGMTITIVRVVESEECHEEPVNFSEQRYNRTDLAPGTEEIVQPGQNGLRQVCERIIFEDGIEKSRIPLRSTILRDPVDQVVFVGVEDRLDPVPIEGTIAYISGFQAYTMNTISSQRQPVTTEGGLDGRVFELSPDGRRLLFTRYTPDANDPASSNELVVILDLENATNTTYRLLSNILAAAWRPGAPYTFFYSTMAPDQTGFQDWTAYNDLWLMTIDPQAPENIQRSQIDEVMQGSGSGRFASWGTRFAWSPAGDKLAYAKADGAGLVDLEAGQFLPYSSIGLEFPYFNPAISENWVWQPTIAWSQDGEWVVTTVHGPPYGSESPNDSILFNVGVFRADGTLTVNSVIRQTGIWANPAYSPPQVNALGFEDYQVAYLQARDWQNSVGAYYDLVIADRDGSNPHRIFPAPQQQGLRPFGYRPRTGTSFDGEFAWSPSGRQLVIVYRGDLWLVDVSSGLARQITNEGQVSSPRWARS